MKFPGAGTHPALVVSRNELIGLLDSCTVLMITHTSGPPSTHVEVSKAEGLDDDCYINTTEIYHLKQKRFTSKIGTVSFATLRRINRCLITNLDLNFPPQL